MLMQDLFADLRPNMTRYTEIEEVNAALVELEEHDRIASSDKASSERHSDTEKPLSRSTSHTTEREGQSIDNGTEDNGVHDDLNDSQSDSGSEQINVEGRDDDEADEDNHDDGSESEDEDDDEDDAAVPASDDEDEIHVRQTVADVDPQAEASFDQELKAVLQARNCIICLLSSAYVCRFVTSFYIFMFYLLNF